MPVQLQLITDKSNAAELLSGEYAMLINVTQTIKIHNSLQFHRFCQKPVNSDLAKSALNCIASL